MISAGEMRSYIERNRQYNEDVHSEIDKIEKVIKRAAMDGESKVAVGVNGLGLCGDVVAILKDNGYKVYTMRNGNYPCVARLDIEW